MNFKIPPPHFVTATLLLVMLFVSNYTFGQTAPIGKGTAYPGNLYHSGGNFGLGHSSAEKLLDIHSGTQIPTIRISHKTASSAVYFWDIVNNTGNFSLQYHYVGQPISTQMLLTHTGQLALGTETPHSSAIFHANSTDKGVLLPKLTKTQRDAIVSPANGLLIYNIDINKFSYYDSGSWHDIAESSDFDNYLTISSFNSSPAGGIENSDITNWNEAHSWGSHSDENYLTSETEQDPQVANNISTNYTAKWNGLQLAQSSIFDNGNIGIGTNTPNASAIFQTDATDRGILIPRLTTTQMNAISSPAEGLLIYNVNENVFSYYSGGWNNIVESSQLSNYLTVTDFNNSPAGGISETDTTNWSEAYNWTQNFEELDPDFNLHLASDIEISDTTRWGTAITWGDHSTFEYITDGNQNWNNEYGFITDYIETDPHIADNISTNYTAKWNGDKLAQSSIFDNGNIGIGTETPTTKLQVDGVITTTEGNSVEWSEAYTQINSLAANKLVTTNGIGGLTSFSYGASEQVLTTNGSGNLQWKTVELETPETFWERTGNRIHLKNNNDNVGIGTDRPQQNLHILKKITNDFIKIKPATIRLENFHKKESNPNKENGFYVWDIETDKNNFNLKYAFNRLDSPKEIETKFTFTDQAYLGLGTDEPETNIHIYSDNPILRFENAYNLQPVNWDIRLNGTSLRFDYKDQPNKIVFHSGGGITAQGRVKAKTFRNMNNSFVVDADGNVEATKFSGDGSGLTNLPKGDFWYKDEEFSYNLTYDGDIVIGDSDFDVAKDGGSEFMKIRTNMQDWYIGAEEDNIQSESGFFISKNHYSDGIFHISNSGNVGIGTSEPAAKLHVEGGYMQLTREGQYLRFNASNGASGTDYPNPYAESVEIGSSTGVIRFWSSEQGDNKLICGSLWAREDVWVQGFDPWADFVFEPDYKLMPLNELETYIATNKHLPEVPSAQEIGENGFKLAEMDALQMQKIEELTLYILQLQEQITKMQKEINQLKKEEK